MNPNLQISKIIFATGLSLALAFVGFWWFAPEVFATPLVLFFSIFNLTIVCLAFCLVLLVLDSYLKKAQTMSEELTLNTVKNTVQRLAHDIKKPLSMMQAVLGIVHQRGSEHGAEILDRHLPKIEATLDNMDEVLEKIFYLSHPLNLEKSTVSTQDLFNEAIRRFNLKKRTKTVRFICGITAVFVLVDPRTFVEAIEIIIENAYDEMPENSLITLDAVIKSSSICQIKIFNEGSAVKKENLKKIFDLFFSTKKSGSGFGLAICKKVVESHNGNIVCLSDMSGTTFIMTIPLDDKIATQNPKTIRFQNEKPVLAKLVKQNTDALTADLGILVVDDEKIYRSILSEQLRSINKKFKIVEADSSEVALEQFANHNFALVILDFDLGRESRDGFYILESIKKQKPDVKVCIHTNHLSLAIEAEATALGADLFLPKPAEIKDLIQFITL